MKHIYNVLLNHHFYVSSDVKFAVKDIKWFQDIWFDEFGNKNYFRQLCNEMIQSKFVVVNVFRINAINYLKKICGNNDPKIARKTEPKSLRAKYGLTVVNNAVYCANNVKQVNILKNEFFGSNFDDTKMETDEGLIIIKPHAMKNNDEIRAYIVGEGFKIINTKTCQLTKNICTNLILDCDSKYFDKNIEHLSSNYLTAIIVTKYDVYNELSRICGNIDPKIGELNGEESIRAYFGENIIFNAVEYSKNKDAFDKNVAIFFMDRSGSSSSMHTYYENDNENIIAEIQNYHMMDDDLDDDLNDNINLNGNNAFSPLKMDKSGTVDSNKFIDINNSNKKRKSDSIGKSPRNIQKKNGYIMDKQTEIEINLSKEFSKKGKNTIESKDVDSKALKTHTMVIFKPHVSSFQIEHIQDMFAENDIKIIKQKSTNIPGTSIQDLLKMEYKDNNIISKMRDHMSRDEVLIWVVTMKTNVSVYDKLSELLPVIRNKFGFDEVRDVMHYCSTPNNFEESFEYFFDIDLEQLLAECSSNKIKTNEHGPQ